MTDTLKRISLAPGGEMAELVAAMARDGLPRLIERDGEVVGILVPPDKYKLTTVPKSAINRDKIMALAGAWSDLDVDKMLDDLYRRREATIDTSGGRPDGPPEDRP